MHEHRLSSGRRFRMGPWRGLTEVAMVTTFADVPLSGQDVGELTEWVRARGGRRIITAALSPREAEGFTASGFEVHRALILLRRPIDTAIEAAAKPLRRWRRRSLEPILDVDSAAFDDFWAFDEMALCDAMSATPHRVLRVNRDGAVQGFALTGVAGARGYLQRLAVDPAAASQGLGNALVQDSLRWMRWHGATEAFVNTQSDNLRAVALYERHGFVAEPEGLVILARELVDDATGSSQPDPD
jgi:ribosomal protein S18 acetylase RimI-like enzyme